MAPSAAGAVVGAFPLIPGGLRIAAWSFEDRHIAGIISYDEELRIDLLQFIPEDKTIDTVIQGRCASECSCDRRETLPGQTGFRSRGENRSWPPQGDQLLCDHSDDCCAEQRTVITTSKQPADRPDKPYRAPAIRQAPRDLVSRRDSAT